MRRLDLRRRKLLGGLLLVVSFGYLFAEKIDWSDFTATSATFDARYSAALLGGQLVIQLLAALALWVLGQSLHPLGFRDMLRAHWRALTIGFWTPTGTGEMSLAWLLARLGMPASSGIALLTVDKLITLGVTALLAAPLPWIIGIDFFAYTPPLEVVILIMWAILLVGLALLLGRSRRWGGLSTPFMNYVRAIDQLARKSLPRLLTNIALTIPRTVLTASVFWWGIESFSAVLTVSFVHFVIVFAAARLIALIAPSPNGLGVLEVLLVEAFDQTSLSASAILAGSLAARIAGLLIVSAGFLIPAGLKPPTSPLKPPTADDSRTQ